MSVNSRVLRVLRLFSPDKALWTVDEVAAALDVSASSAYRYVQELTAAAYLDPVQGGYALGPGLIELDYLIRRHDPIIHAAQPLMRRLLELTTEAATVILCRRCRDRVMCIHQEQGTRPHRPAGYERGVAMPLFQGATSRVILAHETPHVQRRTYAENEAAIRAMTPEATWKSYSAQAAAIRRDGFAETVSEVTAGVRGIAAPVFQGQIMASPPTQRTPAQRSPQRLVASLSLVTEATLDHPAAADLRAAVVGAAQALSLALAPAQLLVAR